MKVSDHRSRRTQVVALAEVFNTTPRQIRRLVAEHRIPYLKCYHFVRFDPQDIASWLAAALVPVSEEETGLRSW